MTYTLEQLKRIIKADYKERDNFLRQLAKEDCQELVELYKQEATYYYTQVAPQTGMSHDLCTDIIKRISNLTTDDLVHRVVTYGDIKQYSYVNSRYDELITQTLMFNKKNTEFIDNRLAQV